MGSEGCIGAARPSRFHDPADYCLRLVWSSQLASELRRLDAAVMDVCSTQGLAVLDFGMTEWS